MFVRANTLIYERSLGLVSHPPYCTDLAPRDFILFPNLKTWLGGKRLSINEKVIDAVQV